MGLPFNNFNAESVKLSRIFLSCFRPLLKSGRVLGRIIKNSSPVKNSKTQAGKRHKRFVCKASKPVCVYYFLLLISGCLSTGVCGFSVRLSESLTIEPESVSAVFAQTGPASS